MPCMSKIARFATRLRYAIAPPRRVHPEFGALRFRLTSQPLNKQIGIWEGYVLFPPAGREVTLWIEAELQDTLDRQQGVLQELIRHFADLRPRLADALFCEYQALRHASPEGCPDYSSGNNLLADLLLERVELHRPVRQRMVSLLYVPARTWSEDHAFTVTLHDWCTVHAAWEG